jgi:hypothetical protein
LGKLIALFVLYVLYASGKRLVGLIRQVTGRAQKPQPPQQDTESVTPSSDPVSPETSSLESMPRGTERTRLADRLPPAPGPQLEDDTDEGVSLEHPGYEQRMQEFREGDREHRYDYAFRHRVTTWKLNINEESILTGIVFRELLGPPKSKRSRYS